ncbi:hypothetical protein N7478_007231 [Penicillium angulare]|uniref:uncharacterized protein n=1 Tax=Penicillium angulare TaxID=116970 RepID=UPI0025424944|nr:uncharacterized protein N7478_007231 [Penicillium angulare]KAJ5281859.1 hypothetical protein N7478_007231 [Penicillium angulare]
MLAMKNTPISLSWDIDHLGIPSDAPYPNMSSSLGADTTRNPKSNTTSKPKPIPAKNQGNKTASLERPATQKKCDRTLPSYPGLERWLLLERIGQGAFSTVYRAKDGEKKHGEVAVKVLRKFEMDKQQLSNMQKEVHIMRSLNHPNTTSLIDAFETKQYCYIIMDLCPGGELFNQIVKLTYLSEDLSRHVIMQVAEAVKYLHLTLGVVHRDIKPENILFYPIPLNKSKTPQPTFPGEEAKLDEGDFIPGTGGGGIGTVKLADYGLSKIIIGDSAATPCGTVGYAAPETMGDQQYTAGVDMWALGCTLYTLLVGYPPFYDPDLRTLIKNVSRGTFEFASPWWDTVSSEAMDLIRGLLAVEPKERLTIEQFFAHPWITKGCGKRDFDVHVDSTSQSQSQLVPTLDTEAKVEARTPDAMNVREIFDVAFAVHQGQGVPGPGLRPTSVKGVSDMMFQMECTPEEDKKGSFLDGCGDSLKQSGLDMSKSTLLEKRRGEK